jgi:MraZ protein
MEYFERKLDDKNRLTIPSELRAEFVNGVVISPGFKNYLHLYTKTTWEAEMEPALKGGILDEAVADLNDRFRSGKVSATLDGKQGRITLEAHLLKHAGLNKTSRELVAVRIATEQGSYWRLRRPV